MTNAINPGLVHHSTAPGKLFGHRQLPSPTHELERWLLGKQLVHHGQDWLVGGLIVESEAYPPRPATTLGDRRRVTRSTNATA
jgi:3-methyladenine DNA glycosylase Mpg